MITVTAPCPDELTPVLSAEAKGAGAVDVRTSYRAVTFQCTPEVYYRCHLSLRTAERLLRHLRTVAAADTAMLLSQARRIPWADLLPTDQSIRVEGVVAQPESAPWRGPELARLVRQAIQQELERRGRSPLRSSPEARLVIHAYWDRGRCTISLDSTLKAMHKRGYRASDAHPSPLKESLAAGVLQLAGYRGQMPLVDAMTGSGTLAIEGTYIALGKAPLIHRPKGEFGFEWIRDFDRKLWQRVQEDTRSAKIEAPEHPIFAYDISEPYVELARQNAERARVGHHITFGVSAIESLTPPCETPGLLVANLPYGARLKTHQDVEERRAWYSALGTHLKHSFGGWQAALLVPDDENARYLSLHPTRKIRLSNGAIPVKLLIFDLYAGTRKQRTSNNCLANTVS